MLRGALAGGMGSGPVELAILVPVLKRPQRVRALLDSIAAATPEPHRVLFIADSDDEEELRAIDEMGAERLTLDPPVNWAQKVNAGYRATTEPFLFLGADDVKPHPGWYPRALAAMGPGIGVVGTNDLSNPRVIAGTHATHMLIRRAYIEEFSGVVDEPDTVIHEGYPHQFGDEELIQTAMARNAYAHAHDSIVEHLHPTVGDRPGKLSHDETYVLGRSQTRIGRQIFRQRQHLWQG